MTSAAVADCCAVIISRLLAVGLDLELALRSPRREDAARGIHRAMGEVNASLDELHHTVLDAALRESQGNGEVSRRPERVIADDLHG